MLRALQVYGFDEWLRDPRNELKGVSLERGLEDSFGNHATGLYDKPPLKVIRLNTARAEDEIRQKLDPGVTDTVSDAGKTLVACLRRSLFHELRHHIHHAYPDLEQDVRLFWRKGHGISRRAGDSWQEYLSESLTAYFFESRALQDHDPAGYNMVVEILQKLGVKL